MFVNYRFADNSIIRQLQAGYVCPDDPRSTMVHELLHWRDAEEYRANGKVIDAADVRSEYTLFQQERAYKSLESDGIDLSDEEWINKNISLYALKKLLDNDFEEVYTEYKTKKLLGGEFD